MSRQKRRSRSDASYVTDTSKDSEVFNDVVLIVEGKKIAANGGILAYNSSVLGDLITTLGDNRGGTWAEFGDIGRTLVSRGESTPRGRDPVEVVLEGESYRAVKTMMGFLQTKYSKAESLSGETAVELLPLTETYKMRRLKKRCGAAILEEMENMRRGKPAGSIPTSVTLKYLDASDKYGLDKVKALCIDECAASFDATSRKDIADDKHIADKTKVVILDKLCDKMAAFYDRNLGKMKKEMEARCREIEEKRQKYVDETEEWKKDFQEEVNNVINNKNYRKLYEHLLEQFEQTKKYIDQLEKEIGTLDDKVTGAIEPLERMSLKVKEAEARAKEAEKARAKGEEPAFTAMDAAFSVDEVINEAFVAHLSEISDTMIDSTNVSKGNVRKVSKTASDYFADALKNFDVGMFQDGFTGIYELQDRLDAASTELDDRVQEIGEVEALYEQEKLQHEKTKAQLMKQMKKVHTINTWVKWAKPIDDDEKRCTCFRHSMHTNT